MTFGCDKNLQYNKDTTPCIENVTLSSVEKYILRKNGILISDTE